MKTLKKSLALLLALAMLTAMLTACGGKENTDALTEEEYEAAVTELTDKLSSIQTDAAGIDPSDVDAAKKVLEDLKQPFNDFAGLTPPEAYADAHAKMKSGCEAMVEYIDTIGSLLEETDETKLSEGATKMMEQMQTAVTDLTEGSTMLAEAQQ